MIKANSAKELEVFNKQLKNEIAERKHTEQALNDLHNDLVEASHKAGMAEVATDVLHNVGNVLNSVNVSANTLEEMFSTSRVSNLQKVTEMIKQNIGNIGHYFQEDPKGKHIPDYLIKLTNILLDEQDDARKRLQLLISNVDHIKEVINMQQSYARVSGVEIITKLRGTKPIC